VGATLYYLPLVFSVQATTQEHLTWLINNLTSNTNVTVALGIMWVSLVGVALVLFWFFVRAMATANRSMAGEAAAKARKPAEAARVG
jgi:hypothetical protein